MFYIKLNTVSKKHAVIKFHENGTYSITDTDSSNGTMVNGAKISETTLKSGDFIQIGDIGITFQN
jgi:pSer/pThr/pTyr-binding forkhead associated (FHA) protein